ncbi:MAG: threonine/serine dehydratase [Acidimicrobiia bacterium]
MPPVTRASIDAASRRIEPHIRATPTMALGDPFDGGYNVTLKLEHLQVTGSFKPRGAFSLLTASEVPPAGVVAASGGNFGLAVAYATERLGLGATIFVPASSPAEKIDRIGERGADVRMVDGFYDEALIKSREWAGESGAFEAHAYDQGEVVAGQGTIGQELEGQVGDLDTVMVAVGGGGLIAGLASWFRGSRRLIAVEPEMCPSFHDARAAGRPIESPVGGVAASSLGARVIGSLAWEAAQWVAESVLVTEEDIVEAQRWLWLHTRLIVEPAAATPLAALKSGRYQPPPGDRVVVLLSGGNTDPTEVV